MKRREFHSNEGNELERARTRRPHDESSSSTTASHPLEAFHRTLGNQAVQRFLRKDDLQATLVIGNPGGDSERKAQRVAEAFVGLSKASAPDRPAEGDVSPAGTRRMLNVGRTLPQAALQASHLPEWVHAMPAIELAK